jgi:very-short-patch-repair endonuclease
MQANQRRDAEVNQRLATIGWTVIRIWDFELQNDLDRSVATVRNALLNTRLATPRLARPAPNASLD